MFDCLFLSDAGTARDHVVKDYARQMMEALKGCKFVIQQAVYQHLTKSTVSIQKLHLFIEFHWKLQNIRISTSQTHFNSQIYQPDYTFTYFNIDDSRAIGMNDNRPTIILGDNLPTKYVVVHNSLPRHRQEVVEFYISKPFVMVEDTDGKMIESQVIPVWSWHRGAYRTLVPQPSNTKYRLLFKATVPPLGLTTYVIRSTNSVSQSL